jgi:poly(3-hydroxybutyrate) depolymerase
VAGRLSARLALLIATVFAAAGARAAEPDAAAGTTQTTLTISDLFSPEQAKAFAPTMRTDRKVTFRLRVPPGDSAHGVLVFVHPGNSALPMPGWADVLDRRNLAYIAAEGYGNDKPGSQRALVALLGLTHLSRTRQIDATRRYIGGMSGGGKMASQVLARFPDFFDGALCIVGAEYVRPRGGFAAAMAGKRVVFVTGDKDFNHFDVLAVHKRFVAAGITGAHLVDIAGFGHQYPDARQLDDALALLDARAE